MLQYTSLQLTKKRHDGNASHALANIQWGNTSLSIHLHNKYHGSHGNRLLYIHETCCLISVDWEVHIAHTERCIYHRKKMIVQEVIIDYFNLSREECYVSVLGSFMHHRNNVRNHTHTPICLISKWGVGQWGMQIDAEWWRWTNKSRQQTGEEVAWNLHPQDCWHWIKTYHIEPEVEAAGRKCLATATKCEVFMCMCKSQLITTCASTPLHKQNLTSPPVSAEVREVWN